MVVFANWNIFSNLLYSKIGYFCKKPWYFHAKSFVRENIRMFTWKARNFCGFADLFDRMFVSNATSPTWKGISLVRGFPQETSGRALHGSPASPPHASASNPTSWPSFFSTGSRRPPPSAQSNGPFPWGQGCGSGLDPESELRIRIQEGKNDPQK